jgi:hypothetical protein
MPRLCVGGQVTTLIHLACITAAWAAAPGPVVRYRVFINGLSEMDVAVAQAVVCIPEVYVATPVTVAAFDHDGNLGPVSDPLVLERVHSFDANGDGVISIIDFGAFRQQFGLCYAESGLVAGCP